MALLDYTHSSVFLTLVLALIPLNSAGILAAEIRKYLVRRRAVTGNGPIAQAKLFDESVQLPGSAGLPQLQQRLEARGYRIRLTETRLAAWSGVSLFPSRMLFLIGTFSLFAGILIRSEERRVGKE